jgi:hypothetical protein
MTFRPYAGKVRLGNSDVFLDIADFSRSEYDGYVLSRSGSEIVATLIGQDKLSLDTPVNESDAATKAYVDSVLSGAVADGYADLEAERLARIAADEALQNQVDNIVSNIDPAALDSLTEIVAAFQNADGDLNTSISALAATASSALAAETAERIANDGYLSADISAEAARAAAAEVVLAADLAAEVARATAAEAVVQAAVDAEVARATAAETDLAADLAAEEAARIAADDELAADLAAEVARATAAEAALAADLAEEEAARQAADLAETAARIAGDESLQSALTNEINDRQAADLAMQADLTAEIGRAIAAETALQADIDAEEVARAAGDAQLTADLAAEVARATAAEAALQGEIDAEEVARAAQDAVLAADIAAEEARALAAEAALQADLSAETVARIAGDAALAADLAAETARATAEEANLQSQINNIISNVDPAALDSLTEIVDAFQGADGYILDSLAALSAGSSSALQAEINRATAAEAALQAAIDAEAATRAADVDAEEVRALAAEGVLQGNIDAEAAARAADVDAEETRALAAEAVLAADLATETARALAAEATLTSDLAAEVARATAAEAVLTSSLNSEISRALAAEDALDAAIAAETARATAAETALTSSINSEILRATAAELALDDAIDAEAAERAAQDGYLAADIAAEEARALAAEGVLQDNIDTEAAARAAADDALDGRLDGLEAERSQMVLFETAPQVYADGSPGSIDPIDVTRLLASPPQSPVRNGWYFRNAVASSKVNWYLFDGMANPVKVGNTASPDLNGYMVVTVDGNGLSTGQNVPVAGRPWFAMYAGTTIAAFLNRVTFQIPSATTLPAKTKVILYFGQDPGASVYPADQTLQRIAMTSVSTSGAPTAASQVFSVAINTNSASSVDAVKMVVEAAGFWSAPAAPSATSTRFHRQLSLQISDRVTPIQSVSINSDVLWLTDVVLANAASSALTVTLPHAAMHNGRQITVKKTDSSANKVTVKAVSGTIDGTAASTGKQIFLQYESLTVVSDGTNWHVL